jgi:hypothetical protein
MYFQDFSPAKQFQDKTDSQRAHLPRHEEAGLLDYTWNYGAMFSFWTTPSLLSTEKKQDPGKILICFLV